MENLLELNNAFSYCDEDTIAYQSVMQVVPMYGKSLKIKLRRLKYKIVSSDENAFDEVNSIIYLFSKENFEYELEFYFAEKKYSKLKFKTLKGKPFQINNVVADSAYLQKGDKIIINHHHIHFHFDTNIKKNEMMVNQKIIKSQLPICILGETGTGKTRLARIIHEESLLPGKFVHLNLASISPTLFESELFGHKKGSFTGANFDKKGAIQEAHMGTLFLDEINSLPIELQIKLLTVLDSGRARTVGALDEWKSNFRLITASNEELLHCLSMGKLRKDFYFRISSGEIVQLPSLNSSWSYFKSVVAELECELEIVVSSKLKDFYFTIKWNGNIRQLKMHLAKKKIIMGNKLVYCPLDEVLIGESNEFKTISNDFQTLKEANENYAKTVYEKMNQNVKATSKVLGIAPNTVRSLVKNYEARM